MFQHHCPVMVPIWQVFLCPETAVDRSGGWYTWQLQHPVDSITCQRPYSQLMHVGFRNAFLLSWLNNITSVLVTIQPLQWPMKHQLRSDKKTVGICLFKYFSLFCFRDTTGSGPTCFFEVDFHMISVLIRNLKTFQENLTIKHIFEFCFIHKTCDIGIFFLCLKVIMLASFFSFNKLSN